MRWAVIILNAVTFWLLMMAVHELGHVVGALVTDGRVARVILHPLAISRTDVSPNPAPHVVAWGGPVLGCAIPMLLWAAWRRYAPPARWAQAFAGFCLVANGAYLAAGAAYPAGDTEELRRLGVAPWLLALVGLPIAFAGFWLWHRMGPAFGMAGMPRDQQRRAAAVSAGALLVVAGAMWTLGSR